MYPNDKPALDFTVIRRNLYDIVIAIGRNFDLAQALSQTPRLSNLAYGLQCLYTAIRRYINNRNESDFATLEYIIKLAKYIHVLSSSCQIPDCANLMDELAIYTWYFQNVFYGLLVKAALEQLGFKDHNNSVGEALKSFKGAIQWNENSSETFFNNYLAICVKANITNRMIDNQPNPDFFSKDNYSEKGYIQLPNEGTGYRSNCRDNNDNWGTPEFVKTLIDIAAQWNRLFPEIMIYYGDLSRKEGGPLAPHKSHQQGVQTDLTFRRGNIKISNMDLETYRQNYCTEFVKLLESFPIINEIFFGDAATGAKVIAGHRNHFHIGSRNR